MKIRIVWLVFETSRSLRNFACPDSRKMAIFQYFRGYFRKVALANVKVELFRPNLVKKELKFSLVFNVKVELFRPNLVRNSNLVFGLKKG